MTEHMNVASFQAEPDKYYGSVRFFRNFRMVFTEGVKYFADDTGSYWLITHIESVLPILHRKNNTHFYMVSFIVREGERAKITFTDGNTDQPFHIEEIEDTNFPFFGEFKFFLCANEENSYTLTLPNEY